MPYKVAVEYSAKSPEPVVKPTEVIADVWLHKPATKSADAVVLLFSITLSLLNDLLLLPV